MAHLRLSLLGPFQVSLDGQLIEHFASNKVRALLAYLAVESNRPHSREKLATLLWPEQPQQKALYYLRNALFDLRKQLGDRHSAIPFLIITHAALQFNTASDYWLDVRDFQPITPPQESQAGVLLALPGRLDFLSRLADAYRGEFLEGLAVESLLFQEWLVLKREEFHQQILEILDHLGKSYLDMGECEKARLAALRQLELESWREEAHQLLMRALALEGRRSEALAQYEICRLELANELGVAPTQETNLLYESIRDGKQNHPPQPGHKKHNLPVELTSFIGREREIAAGLSLLKNGAGSRLVTFTGAGGVGKTRLAIQVAARLVNHYVDGVWLVDLAPVTDPGLIPATLARVLGLRVQMAPQEITFLCNYLEPRHLLLILDNCEHLVEACARLAENLLSACPHLTMLVTSREALGVTGETLFYVPSLSLPVTFDTDHHQQIIPIDTLNQYEATRLFLERMPVEAGFTPSPECATSIAQICCRLDGIPLAIELATACTRLLQVDEILQRLNDCFHLLTGGSRTALPRHQTLRASIDWSYDLLSQEERWLLQTLCVFRGGWSLDAVEFICREGASQTFNAFDLMTQLVNKSLVVVVILPGQPTRYRFLETIRQYLIEKLAESGQVHRSRALHLSYFLHLAQSAESNLRGPDQVQVIERLESEFDNIRLALDWANEYHDVTGVTVQAGLRLASALLYFWHPSYRHTEGIQRLEQLLARAEQERAEQNANLEVVQVRARALFVAGWLAGFVDQIPKSISLLNESRRLNQSIGPAGRRGIAYIDIVLGLMDIYSGNTAAGAGLLEQSLAVFEEEGDQFGISEVLMGLGYAAWDNGECEKTRQLYEQRLRIKQEMGDLDGIAGACCDLGWLAIELGQDEQALAALEQSRSIFEKIHNSYITLPLCLLGMLEGKRGNYARSAGYIEEVVSLGQRWGKETTVANGLVNLGLLAMAQDNFDEAQEFFEKSLAIDSRLHDQSGELYSQWCLGYLAWARGDLTSARKLYTQVLELGQTNAGMIIQSGAHYGLGQVAYAEGNMPKARQHLFDALNTSTHFYPLLLGPGTISCALEALAFVFMAGGDYAQANLLLGATQKDCERYELLRTHKERAMRAKAIAEVQAALDSHTVLETTAMGRSMSLKQAVEYVLREQIVQS